MIIVKGLLWVAQQLRHTAGLFYVERLDYVRQAENQWYQCFKKLMQ